MSYEISTNFSPAWRWIDNDWILIFKWLYPLVFHYHGTMHFFFYSARQEWLTYCSCTHDTLSSLLSFFCFLDRTPPLQSENVSHCFSCRIPPLRSYFSCLHLMMRRKKTRLLVMEPTTDPCVPEEQMFAVDFAWTLCWRCGHVRLSGSFTRYHTGRNCRAEETRKHFVTVEPALFRLQARGKLFWTSCPCIWFR